MIRDLMFQVDHKCDNFNLYHKDDTDGYCRKNRPNVHENKSIINKKRGSTNRDKEQKTNKQEEY